MFDGGAPRLPERAPTLPVPTGMRVGPECQVQVLWPPCPGCGGDLGRGEHRWNGQVEKTCPDCGQAWAEPDPPGGHKAQWTRVVADLDAQGRLPSTMPVEWWPPDSDAPGAVAG